MAGALEGAVEFGGLLDSKLFFGNPRCEHGCDAVAFVGRDVDGEAVAVDDPSCVPPRPAEDRGELVVGERINGALVRKAENLVTGKDAGADGCWYQLGDVGVKTIINVVGEGRWFALLVVVENTGVDVVSVGPLEWSWGWLEESGAGLHWVR